MNIHAFCGFEAAISAVQGPQSCALDVTAIGIESNIAIA
jgi:hypothetical protein